MSSFIETVKIPLWDGVDTDKLVGERIHIDVAQEIALARQGDEDVYSLDFDEGLTLVDNGTPESYGDGSGELRTDQNRIDLVNAWENHLTYVRKDYGADNITGDISIEFEYQYTSSNASNVNIVAGVTDFDIETGTPWVNGNAVFVIARDATSGLAMRTITSGTGSNSVYIAITAGTTYYCTFKRVGSEAFLYVHTNSGRTDLHGSIENFACNISPTRFLQLLSTINYAGNAYDVTSQADNYKFNRDAANLYPTDSPSPTSTWKGLTANSTVDMSTLEIPVDMNSGNAGTVRFQYASNGGALNGIWLGLLQNGGFERGTFTGWVQQSAVIDSSVVHSSKYSSKLEASGAGVGGARTEPLIIDVSKTFKIICWNKVESLSAGEYRFIIRFYSDAAGTTLISTSILTNFSAVTDWTQTEKTIGPGGDVEFPATTVSVRLEQIWDNTPTGIAYMDDVSWHLIETITITDETSSIKIVPQYISDGTQKTTSRAHALVDVTFPLSVKPVFQLPLETVDISVEYEVVEI